MKNIVALLIVILFISSCCKKETKTIQSLCAEPEIGMGDCITDSNYVKPLLLGKWNWTQTISSWTQAKTNPCTDTFNYAYEFLGNGNLKVYENGIFTSNAHYTFYQSYESGISITDTFTSSHPEAHGAIGGVRICGNYLIIDNSPVDGPKIIFVRN